MNLLNPWGVLAGLLAIPVIVAHILRPARRSVEVSSTWLWRAAAVPVTARKPWEKLRWSWPLVLQLLGVALLTLGLTQPVIRQTTAFSDHTVFIFDNSASMGATDVAPNRLGEAKQKAKSLRRKLPSGGIASIVTTDGQVVLSTNGSERSFDRSVDSLKVGLTSPDIVQTALVAQGLQTADRDTGFVLLSDGQLTAAEQRLLPPGLRFEPVGVSGDNLSISQLLVDQTSGGLAATITVRNRSSANASMSVKFTVDEVAQPDVALAVAANATTTQRVALPAGSRVKASLQQVSSPDVFGADDQAFAVVGQRRRVKVKISSGSEASVFLKRAVQALSYVDIVDGDGDDGTKSKAQADVEIFDGVNPPSSLAAPALIFAAPDGYGPVTASKNTPAPALSFVDTSDPLMVGLDLSDILFESAQTLSPGDADVLVSAPETPLIVRGSTGTQPFVYFGFEPEASNLPLDISFPVLIDRIIADLGGATASESAVEVGTRLTTASTARRTVTRPSGKAMPVPAGEPGPSIDEAGFWTLADEGTNESEATSTRRIAANLPVAEQQIEPKRKLDSVTQGDKAGAAGTNRSQRPILRWVIAALLVVALGEWFAVRRRVGVPGRQWKAAQISRGVVSALLLSALIAPRLGVPTKRVATVFALDASDSVGPAGRRQAIEFVEAALAKAPKSARAGVIVFGGNARVTAATQRQLILSDSSPVVDATRTDLASALRLASAVSPSDASRRVILLSDGRRTEGDDTVASEELRRSGIRLDAAIVGRSQPGDVAVASFSAPAKATGGERLTLRAVLQAAEATQALVTLKAGPDIVDQRTIDLRPGPNPWAVDIVAPANGVLKYSLEVKAANDVVVENDLAFAATSLAGPFRVLLLAGDSNTYETGGNGSAALAATLQSSGIEVITKPAAQFSGLDDLTGVSAVVMVDVHRRELNSDQVKALTAGVRELGIGLTVLGGTNSFGSGNYLGSELEALLPVVSEVNDPKRETNVAMAIIIDTSGSMSAPVDGKRTALDLAKAAAGGATRELKEKDYIGVVGVDDDREWVLDVQKRPDDDGAVKAISKLKVGGGTVIEGSLTDAAQRLSKAEVGVRHILVLSDGYTADSNALIQEAAKLRAAGYTVSVVGAGPDIEANFSKVAVAGGGRFIPGGDFKNLPSLFAEETQTVARNLVVEGSFLPRITSAAAPVRDLTTAPEVKGYQASTLRPTAQAFLRVGDYDDPLVASWQAGLGKVTTWASDGGQRWAGGWANWDEPFWTSLIKDTMLNGGTGSVRATVDDDTMTVRVSGTDWPADAGALVTVRGPDGTAAEVQMRRTSDGSFVGSVDAPRAGGYAVGAAVTSNGNPVFRGGSTAIRGYSAEYRPGAVERTRLEGLSKRTGGRGIISASDAFDKDGLTTGQRNLALSGPLLGLAALGWLISIALWRIQFRSSLATTPKVRPRKLRTRTVVTDDPTQPASAVREMSKEEIIQVTPPLPPTNLDQLLTKTREERSKGRRS